MLSDIKFHPPNKPVLDTSLDTLGVGGSVTAFPDQCAQVIEEMANLSLPSDYHLVENVVVSGMGGSALGGRIVASLERQVLKVPVVISTEYHLPNFVSEKSLVIVASYSGTTEETVYSLKEAQARNSKIFVLATGGELAKVAESANLPSYIFQPKHNPSNQPRMALGYSIVSILMLLARCGLIHPLADLGQLPSYLRSRQERSDLYLKTARSLVGRTPVIVSSEHLKGAAHGFRNQINENAKLFADLFDLPELNHHLLEGLSFPKSNPDNLAFLFLKSSKYQESVAKRYPVTQEIVRKNNIPHFQLDFHGPSRLYEAMEMVQAGSFMAYYLALLNGVDPGPIPWVSWYKDQFQK